MAFAFSECAQKSTNFVELFLFRGKKIHRRVIVVQVAKWRIKPMPLMSSQRPFLYQTKPTNTLGRPLFFLWVNSVVWMVEKSNIFNCFILVLLCVYRWTHVSWYVCEENVCLQRLVKIQGGNNLTVHQMLKKLWLSHMEQISVTESSQLLLHQTTDDSQKTH